MAEVLCVYRQVKILKKAAAAPKKNKPSDAVAIISYDEKPGRRFREDRDERQFTASRDDGTLLEEDDASFVPGDRLALSHTHQSVKEPRLAKLVLQTFSTQNLLSAHVQQNVQHFVQRDSPDMP